VASQTILVIEDEKEISDIIEIYLKSRNYHVVTAEDGLVALNKFEQLQPDLIILDILMPNMDGIEFCKQIRQVSNVPILFMSCKKDPEDVIHGLSIGGDDYITKPFDPNVLVARVEANLRRAPILKRWSSSPPPAPILQPLKFGELEIDLQHLRVLLRGVNVSLSNKEMQLLIYRCGTWRATAIPVQSAFISAISARKSKTIRRIPFIFRTLEDRDINLCNTVSTEKRLPRREALFCHILLIYCRSLY
jgi:DNA-binding response OmpR family regulator